LTVGVSAEMVVEVPEVVFVVPEMVVGVLEMVVELPEMVVVRFQVVVGLPGTVVGCPGAVVGAVEQQVVQVEVVQTGTNQAARPETSLAGLMHQFCSHSLILPMDDYKMLSRYPKQYQPHTQIRIL